MSSSNQIGAHMEANEYDYPDDWQIVSVKDAVEFMKAGGTPRRSVAEYWDGEIPFAMIEDVTSSDFHLEVTRDFTTHKGIENSSAWIVPAGSILLTMYGTIGATAINRKPLATNQAILALIPGPKLETNFGAYLFRFHAKRLARENVQSTQKNISKTIVENFRIPLPPLPAQRVIAGILSTVRRAIEASDAVIEAARELKRSLLEYLFTYGPVPVDEAETVDLVPGDIGIYPDHWQPARLSEVLTDTQYGLNDRAKSDGMYPILRMANMADGRVLTQDLKWVDLDDDTFEKYRLKRGHLLFNRTNSQELVGKTSLFEIQGDFVFASYLIRLIPDQQSILPEFLNYYMNWDRTQSRLRAIATRGVSQSNISASKLSRLKVVLPPLKDQELVCEVLSQIDEKLDAEAKRKSALEAMFTSLLHQLMTGKVRVTDTAE